MKAIETVYKGYRFRSRLEARWAVFFDAMLVKWEYEPEGFENDEGEKYLPDFYLPEFDMWCEVKPNDPTRLEEVKKACGFVAKDLKIRALIFLPNIPETSKDNCIFWYKCAYYNPLTQRTAICHVPFAHDVRPDSEWSDMDIPTYLHLGRYSVDWLRDWDVTHDYDMPYSVDNITGRKYCWSEDFDTYYLRRAYDAARQARFEHGEKG